MKAKISLVYYSSVINTSLTACLLLQAQRQQIERHYEMQENMYGHLYDMQVK